MVSVLQDPSGLILDTKTIACETKTASILHAYLVSQLRQEIMTLSFFDIGPEAQMCQLLRKLLLSLR